MAVWEVFVLDGLTLTGDPTGTLVLESLSNPPAKARPEYMTSADSEGAALLREPEHENAETTFRLRVSQQATMNAALDQIGAVRDKLRKASATEGGIVMTWTPAGTTRTWSTKVLTGEIGDLPITWSGDDAGWFQSRPVIPVTLTRNPYWYGAETLSSSASSATPFVTLEIASVPGDVPALGRLIVTDAATQNRRHVEWGLENQDYNAATSLLVDSDNMTTGAGFAGAQAAVTSAYDPNATGNNAISSTVTGFSALALCSTGNLSHVGTFKVIGRIQVTTTAPASVRLSWKANDGPVTANAWVTPVAMGRWEELELGIVSISSATAGTGRWVGQLEGLAGSTTAATVHIDYLMLIPVSEGYGRARATPNLGAGAIVGFDDFTGTTAGAVLNARVAPVGGTWATSGAATDFVFADDFGTEQLARSSVSDASRRLAILGATNYTDTEVQAGIGFSTAPVGGVVQLGVVARYVDASNYVRAFIDYGSNPNATLVVELVAAGVVTLLYIGAVGIGPGGAYWIRLVTYASGRLVAALHAGQSSALMRMVDTTDSRLATGGALQTGKPGLVDIQTGTLGIPRYYDPFTVLTPAAESIAIYSTRTMQIRHDDVIRPDSTNTYYGRPASYQGSRFLVPPGTSRVIAKARRWDVNAGGDAANVTDNTTIQVGWTPRSLVVPRA